MIKLFICKKNYAHANGTYKNFMQIDWVTDADKQFLIEFFVHKYVEQTRGLFVCFGQKLAQYC